MATPYLDLPGLKLITILPPEFIDELETVQPGWIANQLLIWSASIDAKLRKRYAAPFVQPYPLAVQGWLARIVTLKIALRRGIDPNDAQFAEYQLDATTAKAELDAAAETVDPGYDIPLREDTVATGITKGGSMGYSETSPYVWSNVQACNGRNEDDNNFDGSAPGGTFR